MPWGVAAAAISAGTALYSASQSQNGTSGAVNASNQGFNYLAASPVASVYLPNGASANNQAAALLGVNGDPNAVPGTAPAPAAGTSPAPAAAGGMTPGMVAAQNAQLQGGGKHTYNNSPLQDIRQALALGRTISDASWAQAGYGPGGAAIGGAPAAAAAAPGAAVPSATGANPTAGPTMSPNSAFGNYLNSTGTQFQLDEGAAAINSGHASQGILNSGSTSKALIKYGQNLGATSFDNYLKQLGGLSATGLSAGATIGGAAAQGGAGAAKYISGGADTAAANSGGLGGMLSSALGNSSVQGGISGAANYLKGIF